MYYISSINEIICQIQLILIIQIYKYTYLNLKSKEKICHINTCTLPCTSAIKRDILNNKNVYFKTQTHNFLFEIQFH